MRQQSCPICREVIGRLPRQGLRALSETDAPQPIARMNDHVVLLAHADACSAWDVCADRDRLYLVLGGQVGLSFRHATNESTKVSLNDGDVFSCPRAHSTGWRRGTAP